MKKKIFTGKDRFLHRMSAVLDEKRLPFYIWTALAYLSLWILSDFANNSEAFLARTWNHIWLLAYIVTINIILFEYTLPYIQLRWRKLLVAALLLLAHLLLYSIGLYTWRNIGVLLHLYFPLKTFETFCNGVVYHFPYSAGSVFFFGVTKHFYDYRKLRESAQQLRIEKQEAELNYLKSQTNPHFLFNTLNNIYALSRDKSDLAPESILRLSKILRYMLYEAGGEYIAVGQELKIISDYIDLEKLRYDTTLRVNFNYDVEDMKQALPPLLLIPLVENAFKHGVSETRNQPFVDIHLSVKQRRLAFIVKNSTEETPEESRVKENIGLSNLRRQLELLYLDYNLSVQQGENLFTTVLKINLASHV